jgi:hypothetical protein
LFSGCGSGGTTVLFGLFGGGPRSRWCAATKNRVRLDLFDRGLAAVDHHGPGRPVVKGKAWSWNRIDDVRVVNGRVLIREQGVKRSKPFACVVQIPNYYVFDALVQARRRGIARVSR